MYYNPFHNKCLRSWFLHHERLLVLFPLVMFNPRQSKMLGMNKIGLEAMMINEIVKEFSFFFSCSGACSRCQFCSEAKPWQDSLSLRDHTEINQRVYVCAKPVFILWSFTPALPHLPYFSFLWGQSVEEFSQNKFALFKTLQPSTVSLGIIW